MTIHQKRAINDVRECIRHIRNTLDTLMYGSEPPVSQQEYERIREAYDLLCQATDKLP